MKKITTILLMALVCHSWLSHAQQPASGWVKDRYGYGLPFVEIRNLHGEKLGETDESGAFSVSVADTATLLFNYVGYEPLKVHIKPNNPELTLILTDSPIQRDVQVAFGTRSQQEITAAIASVESGVLRQTPVPNLSNTLYGRLPGLTVMQGSGEPGYDAPTMLIRGKGTYQDNSFLVFVDGLETSFDQLSVDEIETISVLKDAAALVQFGIRGANGALWATTKRGQPGKTRITLNARTGWQQPTGLPAFVNAYDYARLYNEAQQNDGLTPMYTQGALEAYRTGSDPYLYPDVNWYDEVLRHSAPQQDLSLTFSGGGQTARYFILLGHNRNEGLYANTDRKRVENSNADFRRYNFRANVNMLLSKYVSAAMDLGGRVEDRYFPNFNGSDLWENMARYPANAYPVRNPNGTWGGNALFFDNPVASVLDRGLNSSTDRNLMATLRLTEHLDFLTEGLRFNQTVSFNNWHRGHYDKTRDIAVYELSGASSGGEEYVYRQHGTRTDLAIDQGGNNQWNRTNLQFSLNYDRAFGSNDVSAQVMYYQDVYAVSGNNVPYANQSVMGRFHYGYKSRYFAELGLSYSGSERFPQGNRFGLFPALSAAWLISNEDFLIGNQALSYLKLRGSAGLLGNDRLVGPRFAYQQDFYYTSDYGYRFGRDNTWFGSIIEGVPGNALISWEKSLQYNLGVDAVLYNRFNLGIDAFYENRWDILATDDASVPGYVGLGTAYRNLGKVRNLGFEATASYRHQIGDFQYSLGGSVFYSRNKILEMNEIIRPESYLYRTGHQVTQPFGLQADGFWQEADFDANGNLLPDFPVSTFAATQPGDIRYVDQNGDGLIDENDYTAIGNAVEPALTYTFDLGGAYKGFDVNLFFHGTAQRNIFLSDTYFWALQDDSNIPTMALDRWTPETATTATYPRLSTLPNDNNYQLSSFWMRSGAALRLRNIEVGYTLPAKAQAFMHLHQLRIYASGINLVSWYPSGGIDPDNLGGYPPLKSYNVGLTARF